MPSHFVATRFEFIEEIVNQYPAAGIDVVTELSPVLSGLANRA